MRMIAQPNRRDPDGDVLDDGGQLHRPQVGGGKRHRSTLSHRPMANATLGMWYVVGLAAFWAVLQHTATELHGMPFGVRTVRRQQYRARWLRVGVVTYTHRKHLEMYHESLTEAVRDSARTALRQMTCQTYETCCAPSPCCSK